MQFKPARFEVRGFGARPGVCFWHWFDRLVERLGGTVPVGSLFKACFEVF
jgi:hypothetical protein